MKNLFLLVLLLLLSWSTARSLLARDVILTVDSHPAAVAAANKAHELEKKGDLEGAIHYYSAAVKTDPGMYVAIYSRGEIYMQ